MASLEKSIAKTREKLTAVGWAVIAIIIPFLVILNVSIFSKDKTWDSLVRPEPSTMLLGIYSVIVALETPIVILAWRRIRQRSPQYLWMRAFMMMWFGLAVASVIDGAARGARIESWSPESFPIFFSLLLAVHYGFGLKRADSPLDNSTLNSPDENGRRAGLI